MKVTPVHIHAYISAYRNQDRYGNVPQLYLRETVTGKMECYTHMPDRLMHRFEALTTPVVWGWDSPGTRG